MSKREATVDLQGKCCKRKCRREEPSAAGAKQQHPILIPALSALVEDFAEMTQYKCFVCDTSAADKNLFWTHGDVCPDCCEKKGLKCTACGMLHSDAEVCVVESGNIMTNLCSNCTPKGATKYNCPECAWMPVRKIDLTE